MVARILLRGCSKQRYSKDAMHVCKAMLWGWVQGEGVGYAPPARITAETLFYWSGSVEHPSQTMVTISDIQTSKVSKDCYANVPACCDTEIHI